MDSLFLGIKKATIKDRGRKNHGVKETAAKPTDNRLHQRKGCAIQTAALLRNFAGQFFTPVTLNNSTSA